VAAPGVYTGNSVTMTIPVGNRSLRHKLEACPTCKGTGGIPVGAFFVGRYPVTWGEYLATCRAFGHPWPDVPRELSPSDYFEDGFNQRVLWGSAGDAFYKKIDRHPVTRVTFGDADAFCIWNRLRLPTAAEWTLAAFGTRIPCPGSRALAHGSYCSRCGMPGSDGKITRRWPWDEDKVDYRHERPDPEHWAGSLECSNEECDRGVVVAVDVSGGCSWCAGTGWERAERTAPVTIDVCPVHREPIEYFSGGSRQLHVCKEATGRGVPAPARPKGASLWSGAQDMLGNVREWAADPVNESTDLVLGQSYRGQIGCNTAHGFSSSETGFRVALSVPT
jgi:hypothetical protein